MIQPRAPFTNVSDISEVNTSRVTGTCCGELMIPAAEIVTVLVYCPGASPLVLALTLMLVGVVPEVAEIVTQAASAVAVQLNEPTPPFCICSACDGGFAWPESPVKFIDDGA